MANPDTTFISLPKGESMQEIGIFEGDLLLVDRSEQVKDDDVIVANYNGCFTCKFIDKKYARLLSASALHQAVRITPEDKLQIEGVVTRSI